MTLPPPLARCPVDAGAGRDAVGAAGLGPVGDLIDAVGPAGTAWLRLSIGALVFLAVARPPLRSVRRDDLPALVGLGVTSGLVTIAFLAAIERIPLGTAVAVEFLGPLTVAAVRSHSAPGARRGRRWRCSASSG